MFLQLSGIRQTILYIIAIGLSIDWTMADVSSKLIILTFICKTETSVSNTLLYSRLVALLSGKGEIYCKDKVTIYLTLQHLTDMVCDVPHSCDSPVKGAFIEFILPLNTSGSHSVKLDVCMG